MRRFAWIAVLLLGCDARSALSDRAGGDPAPAGGGAGAAGGGSSVADGGGTTGGGGSACVASGAISIGAVRVIDADGDGLFEPGERVLVEGYIQNAGATRYGGGLRVTADDPRVQPVGASEAGFYVLPAGTGMALSVPFLVSEELGGGSEVGFTLALIDVDDPACASSTAETVIAVSSFSWDLDTCAMTRQLELSELRVADADGDGRVEPGEDITLTVTLTNPGPLDHGWYPGVQIISNDMGVTVRGYGNWLYALPANRSAPLSTIFHVDGSVLPGAVTRFSLSAAALNVRCRGVRTLEYSVLIQ